MNTSLFTFMIWRKHCSALNHNKLTALVLLNAGFSVACIDVFRLSCSFRAVHTSFTIMISRSKLNNGAEEIS